VLEAIHVLDDPLVNILWYYKEQKWQSMKNSPTGKRNAKYTLKGIPTAVCNWKTWELAT